MDNDLNSDSTSIETEIFPLQKYLLRSSPDAGRLKKVPVDDNCTDYDANIRIIIWSRIELSSRLI